MKALTLTDQGLRYVADHAPQPDSDHVPVRVLKAGICETDLQLVRGYMGFRGVLGHEFVGIAQSGKYAGERVVGEINCACLKCDECRAGLETHCPNRTVLGILNHDGAFAETVWLPERNLHAVPDSVSDDAAVMTEPLAAAFQIPAQLDLTKFQDVLVLGDGRLGNLCSQVLALHGCNPLVIGKHSQKLDRIGQLGVRTALLSEVKGRRMADIVVDCTGSASGFTDACRFIRPRGTIVLKTTVAGESGPNLAPIVIDEITLVGSRCGPFVPALEALAVRSVEVESMITSRFPLADGSSAFEAAADKKQLKVILEG